MINVYSLIRDGLFCLEAEKSHHLALSALRLTTNIPCALELAHELGLLTPIPTQPIKLGTLNLPGPIGLAAGLDKNAEYLSALFALGFHCVEVGTATPLPQAGNPQPRLFRLPEYSAIINRMGFNNEGINALVERVRTYRQTTERQKKPMGIIGINLGKNAQTPNDMALNDYRTGVVKAHALADYLTINLSSPNTKGLRDLQTAQNLRALMEPLQEETQQRNQQSGRSVGLWVKVAPDLSPEDIDQMAEVMAEINIAGVIATNTTLSREGVSFHRHAQESGGLSGAPLKNIATENLARWRQALPATPLIGVGGIMSGEDALEKRRAGANAVQIYSGLIYQGPRLLADIARSWLTQQD